MNFRFHAINQRLVYRRMHSGMMSDDRLYGALGRLKTVQNARRYGWESCMEVAELDEKEAARHHVYALYLWAEGERLGARKHFLRAAELYRPTSRQRRALCALYLASAACICRLDYWLGATLEKDFLSNVSFSVSRPRSCSLFLH